MLAYGAEGGVEGYGVVHVLYIIRYGMVVWLSLVPRVDELGEGRAAAWREREVDGVVARRLGLREACAGLGDRGVAALQLALCLEHAQTRSWASTARWSPAACRALVWASAAEARAARASAPAVSAWARCSWARPTSRPWASATCLRGEV